MSALPSSAIKRLEPLDLDRARAFELRYSRCLEDLLDAVANSPD
jgi:hypothetical protein